MRPVIPMMGFPAIHLRHTRAFAGHQRPMTFWHARNEKPYPGGITAVYAQALEREEIFQGLEKGNIYASSDYGRPYLDFSINGVSMTHANELFVDSEDLRTLEIFFAQDGGFVSQEFQEPIEGADWVLDWEASIEVLKNGQLWTSVQISGPVASIKLEDHAPVTGAEYGFDKCMQKDGTYYINAYSDQPVDPAELNTGGADFYIIRTVSAGGREAYIGPMWVSVENDCCTQ